MSEPFPLSCLIGDHQNIPAEFVNQAIFLQSFSLKANEMSDDMNNT